MTRWMTIKADCWECGAPGVEVSADAAAEGICRADGQAWAMLKLEDRDYYRDLAVAALEAVGAEG